MYYAIDEVGAAEPGNREAHVKETTLVRFTREGQVARLVFDRPEQLNALGEDTATPAFGGRPKTS